MYTEKISDQQFIDLATKYLFSAMGEKEEYKNSAIVFRNAQNSRVTVGFYPEIEGLNNYFIIFDDYKLFLDCPQTQNTAENINLQYLRELYSIVGEEFLRGLESEMNKLPSGYGNRTTKSKETKAILDKIKNVDTQEEQENSL